MTAPRAEVLAARRVVVKIGSSSLTGAEMLGRRGEDERLREERPAATRRKDIQEQMPDRSETETRADVARRIDRSGKAAAPKTITSSGIGPMSYEIGSKDDPDWDGEE